MASLFQLEEFEAALMPGFGAELSSSFTQTLGDEGEGENNTAFEQGYKAGWDDAARASAEDQTRISTEFARNLQDLGFTFHEARSHMMRSLEPLLMELAESLLPELVAQTLGARIVEEIMPMAESAADRPIEIVVSPASRAALEPLLSSATTVPLTLSEEPSLAAGQVHLRSGKVEKEIDLTGAIERVTAVISAAVQSNEKVFRHG